MILVGLTGGIGSGKSTVSALLAGRGAVVIDADAITRQLQEPGQPVLTAIVERFGTQVLDSDGRLNRPVLAAIVFNDPEALKELNAIVHPAVGVETARRIAAEQGTDHVVVLDVPLLVETGRGGLAAIIVVDVPTDIAIQRLAEQRGMAEADARARVAVQASREEHVGKSGHHRGQLRRARRTRSPRSRRCGTTYGRSRSNRQPEAVTHPLGSIERCLRSRVVSDFEPAGDQPHAIEQLAEGIERGDRFQTLLGITGSGKSATIAWTIEKVQRPTLVLAPNKSLAAQLANEFREFFPNNRVEYFVSYYDYYQPEAYIPSSDTYIEKDSSINDEIDRLRHAATAALLTRRDVIVVASVSCIYGMGNPDEYRGKLFVANVGQERDQRSILRQLVDMQYERNDAALGRGQLPGPWRHHRGASGVRGDGHADRALR